MPGDGLRVLQLYPKLDFFTGALAVAADPRRSHDMARRGRRLVEAKFSTRVKIARAEALYPRLLESVSTAHWSGQ